MIGLRAVLQAFTNAGVTAKTSNTDKRYIRFLNTTLLIFVVAQVPIIPLLIRLELWTQLATNLAALSIGVLGFLLHRSGRYLTAKVLIIGVMTANTAYFAALLGSTAPTHLWLVPMAVLGVLAFKPSEWNWATIMVGVTLLGFVGFELAYPELEPVIRHFTNPEEERSASRGSTVSAILLTLVLVGMMHRRFSQSETALSREKTKSDRLLRAILPDEIADELKETGTTQAVRHEDVSLLFADIVGFTPLAASMPAEEVVALLAEIFKRFDVLITDCGVEKIKTIGDAYMVAGGVPTSSADHAHRLARCACGMLETIEQFSRESGHDLQLRIGLHRGPVVAGGIGTTKFAYDMWGESVNLAARIEASGEPGRVHVSDAFRLGLEDTMEFEARGERHLKGVGLVHTHWLLHMSHRR
ncbi:MAG: hypothetical protein CL927_12965 [Deltaproteobacteria bacterium]|nr:hypothetical protein [Deltaproteobacteria bacterium]HCH65265.1 hypothetical protein [Deltaproteobacteria bacterium]